jgi:hypothetical protein
MRTLLRSLKFFVTDPAEINKKVNQPNRKLQRE